MMSTLLIDLRANAGAQDEFLRTSALYPALIGGQGSGKTWGGAARLVLEHVAYPGSSSLVIEPTFSLLRQVALPAIVERLDECGIQHTTNLSTMEILTPQLGSKILLHSGCAAETITGFEVGRTWIDEPARIPEHDDPRRNVWIAAIGRTRCPKVPTHARRVMVTGTHEGKGTWVYHKWEKSPKPGYEVHRARTSDNPSSREQEKLYLEEYGPELAAQYVYGFAVEDSMAAVPYAVLEGLQDGRCSEGDLASLRNASGPLFVGMDIGRSKSLTVFWVVSQSDAGQLTTEAVLVYPQTEFSEQFKVIKTLVGLPGFAKMAIDGTYNPQTAEDAVKAFGDSRIENVKFTHASKIEVFQYWIKACQDGRLRIPVSDEILNDFFSVKRVVSSQGVVQYHAPFTADGHADRASAAGLAVWVSRGGKPEYSSMRGPELESSKLDGL